MRIRGLIGVIHLPPFPGDPLAPPDASFDGVVDAALGDLRALVVGGAHAVLVENFGSAPFYKGNAQQPVPPHQVAALARVVARCVAECELPVGVNCLRNDARAALAVAAACGGSFVRVNVHTGACVTDQGIIEGEAADTLRYRRTLSAEHVAIFADVMVKHASPLAPLPPDVATRDLIQRGRADAVIVTGFATGGAVDATLLANVRDAAADTPVYIGSGLNPDNAAALAPLANGAIVGTALKRDGVITAPVDADRVRALATLLDRHLLPE